MRTFFHFASNLIIKFWGNLHIEIRWRLRVRCDGLGLGCTKRMENEGKSVWKVLTKIERQMCGCVCACVHACMHACVHELSVSNRWKLWLLSSGTVQETNHINTPRGGGRQTSHRLFKGTGSHTDGDEGEQGGGHIQGGSQGNWIFRHRWKVNCDVIFRRHHRELCRAGGHLGWRVLSELEMWLRSRLLVEKKMQLRLFEAL